MKLQASDVSLVEITLTADSDALGKPLAALPLPPDTLIVTVVRENAMTIPRAETVLQPDDKVLAITNVDNQKALEAIFGHH
jgi:trk system potassium uptake protein TrkA